LGISLNTTLHNIEELTENKMRMDGSNDSPRTAIKYDELLNNLMIEASFPL
jgi:hypothetical protein